MLKTECNKANLSKVNVNFNNHIKSSKKSPEKMPSKISSKTIHFEKAHNILIKSYLKNAKVKSKLASDIPKIAFNNGHLLYKSVGSFNF